MRGDFFPIARRDIQDPGVEGDGRCAVLHRQQTDAPFVIVIIIIIIIIIVIVIVIKIIIMY